MTHRASAGRLVTAPTISCSPRGADSDRGIALDRSDTDADDGDWAECVTLARAGPGFP